MNGYQALQAEILSATGGRADVYAIQNPSGAYYPQHSELTLEKYSDDSTTIGAYLVGLDGCVKSGAFDIDINRAAWDDPNSDRDELIKLAQKQTLQIKTILEQNGFQVILEDSGQKGYHVWFYFNSAIPARDLRYTMEGLAKGFHLIDPRLHWEIFPKQASVGSDGFGNLIKLPFQFHKVSKRRCVFVDENFEQYLPDQLPLNSIDLVRPASRESIPPTPRPEKSVQRSIAPSNMDLMFEKCVILNELEKSANSEDFEGAPGHEKRLFLASQMKPFGEKGRKKVHEILSLADDYDPDKTDYHMDSLTHAPANCEMMCGDQRCANICKADGRSPIKFGFQKDIVPFLEKQTSSYAYYDQQDEQVYFVDSEKKLSIILRDADQEAAEMPVLKIIFDPQKDVTIDRDKKTVNLFKPTDYLVMSKNSAAIDPSVKCPSIIKLLSNLVPNASERDRYLNWLAGILQTRKMQQTSWVFMGSPGAGKNVMLDHLLKPLIGIKQAIKVEDAQLRSEFNAWQQNAMIIAFNEVAHDNRSRNTISNKIKAIVTDPDATINEKNVKTFTVDNYVNALFFSNNEIPILIENGDRRFNVVRTAGNLRQKSWFSDPEKFFEGLRSELKDFAQFLMNYDYNPIWAKTVISNTVKTALVDAGMTRFEEFASHLKSNDVDWFVENDNSLLPSSNLAIVGLSGFIDKEQALSLFRSIYQDERMTKTKLTNMLKLYDIRAGEANGKKAYRWD